MTALRTLALLALPAVAAVGGAVASSGCGGVCCHAVCVSVVGIELTGPTGVATTSFHGHYRLPGGESVFVDCATPQTTAEWGCSGGTLVVQGAPAEIELALESTAQNASFVGTVDPDYHEETVCCDTCDVGSVDIVLVAN